MAEDVGTSWREDLGMFVEVGGVVQSTTAMVGVADLTGLCGSVTSLLGEKFGLTTATTREITKMNRMPAKANMATNKPWWGDDADRDPDGDGVDSEAVGG